MTLVCRSGGCGPVVVMRTGLHLGGSPGQWTGSDPAGQAPVGASSATASAHRGFIVPDRGSSQVRESSRVRPRSYGGGTRTATRAWRAFGQRVLSGKLNRG